MSIEDEYSLLSRIDLFEYLEPLELKRLIFASRRYQLNPGEYLFRQGDSSDTVFGILQGEFSILLQSNHGEINVEQEDQGALLGELAAISGKPRSASVRAETDCDVIGFERELFLNTIVNNPQTALKMMKLLSDRLVNLDEYLTRLTDSQFVS